jgi:hypothetical protein
MPKKEIKAVRRKPTKEKKVIKPKPERKLTLVVDHEAGEFEITRKATDKVPEKKIRIPKEAREMFQMMPHEFQDAQNAIEAYKHEKREVEVYSTSMESFLGYDSLIRVMTKWFNNHVAYLRSEEGGMLSLKKPERQPFGETSAMKRHFNCSTN